MTRSSKISRLRRGLTNGLARLYDSMPSPGKALSNTLRLAPSYLTWRYSAEGRRRTLELLAPLIGRFEGFRCIVIGNGPSLNRTDLSLLDAEYTIGLNRINLLYDKLAEPVTFHLSVNRFVMEQFGDEIGELPSIKLLSWRFRKKLRPMEPFAYVVHRPGNAHVLGNILAGLGGAVPTVTLAAIDLAYTLGFSEVILIGVDHTFAQKGPPNIAVVASGDDEDHFSKDYFARGTVWQLPDYIAMEKGYAEALKLFETNGRRIVDATVDGHLHVFPKVDLEAWVRKSYFKNRANAGVS